MFRTWSTRGFFSPRRSPPIEIGLSFSNFFVKKDWLLFFLPNAKFLLLFLFLFETLLVFNCTKRRIQLLNYLAETFSRTSSRHIEMKMVAMRTCHVNLKLKFDWLIVCFGPGYQI